MIPRTVRVRTILKVPIVAPAKDGEEIVHVPGAPAPNSLGPSDDDVDHLVNWFTAMQARKEPNATVDHGFSHAIVCIMAAQSYWSGRKIVLGSRKRGDYRSARLMGGLLHHSSPGCHLWL